MIAVPFIRSWDGEAVASTFLALVDLRTLTAVSACFEEPDAA
jgi:hypothetical protein